MSDKTYVLTESELLNVVISVGTSMVSRCASLPIEHPTVSAWRLHLAAQLMGGDLDRLVDTVKFAALAAENGSKQRVWEIR